MGVNEHSGVRRSSGLLSPAAAMFLVVPGLNLVLQEDRQIR